MRPFAGDRWTVLLLMLAFAALATVAGYALEARRDLGAGLLPDRAGPATAPPSLSSALGLAWRLHRGVLAAWLIGFVVLGFVLGSVASDVGTLLDSPEAQEMIRKLGGEKGLTDAFLAAELSIMGGVTSVFAVQAASRLRAEEVALRAEPVLATAVGRLRWAASHLSIAVLGAAPLLLSAGLATGLAPRLVAARWATLVAFLLLGELGPLFQLAQPVMNLSPFTHLPRLPGGEFRLAPLIWLTLVAAALTIAGLAGLRRRDVG